MKLGQFVWVTDDFEWNAFKNKALRVEGRQNFNYYK